MAQSQAPTLLMPFTKLKDPRIHGAKKYALLDLIFIALSAVVSGANDCVAIAKFAQTKRPWLEKYLDLPETNPSHDTFSNVFAAIEGQHFMECFLLWVEALQESTNGKIVAIDGKTARATLDRAKDQNPLHVVRAWAAENRLFLGQGVGVHQARQGSWTRGNAQHPNDGRTRCAAKSARLERSSEHQPLHAHLPRTGSREIGSTLFHQQLGSVRQETGTSHSRTLGDRERSALGVGQVLCRGPQPCPHGPCRRELGLIASLGDIPTAAGRGHHRKHREETLASGLE
jgi:DDE_Tnp_1-associated